MWACEAAELPDAVHRIAVAVTAMREKLDNFDCILVPADMLKAAGFDVVNTPKSGRSGDPEINKHHHDIRSLTARKLCELVALMTPQLDPGAFPRRETVMAPRLARELLDAEGAGRVKMKDRLRPLVHAELADEGD